MKKDAKKPQEILVVTSKIKQFFNDAGLRSTGDLPEAISVHLEEFLNKAIFRATSNGRSTIKPEDL